MGWISNLRKKWRVENEEMMEYMVKHHPTLFDTRPPTRLEKVFFWFLMLALIAVIIGVMISH